MSKIGEIRREEQCMEHTDSKFIWAYFCHGKGWQVWQYKEVSCYSLCFHEGESTLKDAHMDCVEGKPHCQM